MCVTKSILKHHVAFIRQQTRRGWIKAKYPDMVSVADGLTVSREGRRNAFSKSYSTGRGHICPETQSVRLRSRQLGSLPDGHCTEHKLGGKEKTNVMDRDNSSTRRLQLAQSCCLFNLAFTTNRNPRNVKTFAFGFYFRVE